MSDSPDDLVISTEWKFEGHLLLWYRRFRAAWSTGEIYGEKVRAVLEEQYLPNDPAHVHRMELFYNSAAEPDRDSLKMRG